MATKTVLITGAGIGIGRATALGLCRSGYHVVVTDVLEAKARRSSTPSATAAAAPVSIGASMSSSTDDAECTSSLRRSAHGGARRGGGECRHRPSRAAWRIDRRVLGSHARRRSQGHPARGSRRARRHELARRSGAVVALSSIMGVAYGWDEHVHYSAAKSGVVGLVRGLAVELARSGIRVNGVAPGYIRTAQALSTEHSLGPAGLEKAGEFIPMGRVGEPEDIADVIVFFSHLTLRDT